MTILPRPGSVALAAIELVRIQLPLVVPFAAAHGTESTRDVVLVRALGADGHEGWGECPTLSQPTYTAEHTDAAWAVLCDRLAPAAVSGRLGSAGAHPMAWAAIELALLDLQLRRDGVPLVEAIGARAAPVSSRAVLGGAASIDALVQAAADRLAAGHRSLKIKIAPGWDLDPLRAVRDAFPDVALSADANGSYGLDDLDRLRSIGDLLGHRDDVHLEQPVARDDLDGSARVAAALAVPIALDESIASRADAEAALAMGAGRVISVKPARLGGIRSAIGVADLLTAVEATRHGASGFVGGMLETGVGRAAALAVAGHGALLGSPADLGPSSAYFEDDLTEPFVLDADGCLVVPAGHGLGVTPRPDRLADTVVARALVEP